MRTARRMRLQGAGNVRDLGGYPCGETITAWQCCYRSDMLNNLTQEDWKKLQEADIQLILDLRSKTEQIQAPYDSETLWNCAGIASLYEGGGAACGFIG
ncbi:MAG: tyrosine-protein phosphatase [[Clostridium] innocuum]